MATIAKRVHEYQTITGRGCCQSLCLRILLWAVQRRVQDKTFRYVLQARPRIEEHPHLSVILGDLIPR